MGQKKSPYGSQCKIVLRLPPSLFWWVKEQSEESGCSLSWVICDALMLASGVTHQQIIQDRGYDIPKEFKNRTGAWTPAKLSSCDNCGQPTEADLCDECFQKLTNTTGEEDTNE